MGNFFFSKEFINGSLKCLQSLRSLRKKVMSRCNFKAQQTAAYFSQNNDFKEFHSFVGHMFWYVASEKKKSLKSLKW